MGGESPFDESSLSSLDHLICSVVSITAAGDWFYFFSPLPGNGYPVVPTFSPEFLSIYFPSSYDDGRKVSWFPLSDCIIGGFLPLSPFSPRVLRVSKLFCVTHPLLLS